MPSHITINGRPWCRCCTPEDFGLPDKWAVDELQLKLHQAMRARNVRIICSTDGEAVPEHVAALREFGLNAAVTSGHCPTLTEAYDD